MHQKISEKERQCPPPTRNRKKKIENILGSDRRAGGALALQTQPTSLLSCFGMRDQQDPKSCSSCWGLWKEMHPVCVCSNPSVTRDGYCCAMGISCPRAPYRRARFFPPSICSSITSIPSKSYHSTVALDTSYIIYKHNPTCPLLFSGGFPSS
jgi:hypothetical protein